MTDITKIEPIVRSVTVRASQEEAFRLFTEGSGTWWPLETHRVLNDSDVDVVFEGRVNGRIFERAKDGTEASWGHVLEWDPPRRVVYDWQPNTESPAPTEVEVRFTSEDGGTRVEIEHRGWERLGDIAAEARANYNAPDGWTMVIARYVDAAGGDA
ncbi:MAG: hypothetical protein QOH90_1954 [Actinomycetota bacterium]|nr:hypothetical protein [Actinomycetota bacterium]